MVLAESIGKYRVGRTIGEGAFAKVRLAVDAETGSCVAVKVIDRSTVLRNNLMYQVPVSGPVVISVSAVHGAEYFVTVSFA